MRATRRILKSVHLPSETSQSEASRILSQASKRASQQNTPTRNSFIRRHSDIIITSAAALVAYTALRNRRIHEIHLSETQQKLDQITAELEEATLQMKDLRSLLKERLDGGLVSACFEEVDRRAGKRRTGHEQGSIAQQRSDEERGASPAPKMV